MGTVTLLLGVFYDRIIIKRQWSGMYCREAIKKKVVAVKEAKYASPCLMGAFSYSKEIYRPFK